MMTSKSDLDVFLPALNSNDLHAKSNDSLKNTTQNV